MGKRTFQAEYGPESGLVEIQDMLIKAFADSPWYEYDVPVAIRRSAIDLWICMK